MIHPPFVVIPGRPEKRPVAGRPIVKAYRGRAHFDTEDVVKTVNMGTLVR